MPQYIFTNEKAENVLKETIKNPEDFNSIVYSQIKEQYDNDKTFIYFKFKSFENVFNLVLTLKIRKQDILKLEPYDPSKWNGIFNTIPKDIGYYCIEEHFKTKIARYCAFWDGDKWSFDLKEKKTKNIYFKPWI